MELAVWSAPAHGNHEGGAEVVLAAAAALDALAERDAPRTTLYFDLIWSALDAAARRLLEAEMEIQDYEYQTDFLRRAREEGRKEGLAAGRRVLHRLLAARLDPLPADAAARIDRATPDELDTWAERVLGAVTMAEVFGE